MCGIFVYLKKKGFVSTVGNGQLYESFTKSKHRGPDKSLFVDLSDYGVCLGFHRLAIMDRSVKGDQPFSFEDQARLIYVLCNGEIYNFRDLCAKYNLVLQSGSDCEVILHLYRLIGVDAMIKEFGGEFSFCVCDIDKVTGEVKLFIGRDQAGTRMLHITGSDDDVVIVSEAKSSPFLDKGYDITQFPPRHYLEISNADEKIFDSKLTKCTKWLDLRQIKPTIFTLEEATAKIRQTLIKIVKSMTMGERKLCCLLSGGLDSSLIAAILAEICKELGITLYTFSIGLDSGSSDRPFAEMVAKHIGSIHYHIEITEQYALETLAKIPGIIESMDITTCRASVFQYLALEWISLHTDFKIVFCGDGSDEYGSYKYFHNAPSPEAFHYEGIRLIEDVHMYDGLRAGMCATACGLEIRFAFLAREFMELVFSIDPILRMPKNGMEKWLFRQSFVDTNYLPPEVLWRSKEALSDACSTGARLWYEMIRDHVDLLYSDEELEAAKIKYADSHMPIVSKESLHYRLLFEQAFGPSLNTQKIIPYYWLPKWCGTVSEPSATILDVYKQTTQVPLVV